MFSVSNTYFHISNVLGKGYSKKAIVSSIALVVIMILYSLSLASIFNPDIYRFIARTTYYQYFESTYLFSQQLDNHIIVLNLLIWVFTSVQKNFRWIIFLPLASTLVIGLSSSGTDIFQFLSVVSLPFIISLYVLNNRVMNHNMLYNDSGRFVLNYFSVSVMFLAFISIYLSAINSNFSGPFIDIISLFSRYSHVILFLIIFSLFVRVIIKRILQVTPRKLSAVIFKFTRPFDIPTYTLSKKSIIGLLSFSIVFSVIVVLIPHLDGSDRRIAVDTSSYEVWISPMQGSEDIGDIIRIAFLESPAGSEGDRPLSLLILFAISSFSDTIYGFEIILPSVLAPLLVLCIFFLTKELTNSALVAIFSAFITSASFQVMIGMYSGFYANWIALLIGYSSLLFGIRFLKTHNHRYLIVMSASMLLLLFSHIYTWTIITIFFIIFLIALRWKKVYESKQIIAILVILICVILIDLSKSYFGGLDSGFQHDIGIAESNDFGLSDRWSRIVGTVHVHLGGIFSNVIILSLALYTAIFLKSKHVVYLFIMVFLSIGIVPLLFGDRIVQSRILYDIPFQIPAGLALSNLFISQNGRVRSIAIVVSISAISIYVMNNLGVAPS